jgi:hypothetical protein
MDYIDGYPSVYGNITIDDASFKIDGHMVVDEVFDGLGVPEFATSEGSITAGALCGSGIMVESSDLRYDDWKGYRFDCQCLKYQCGEGTVDPELHISCNTSQFYNGRYYDFNIDKVDINRRMMLNESIGGCSSLFDQTDVNMFLDNLKEKGGTSKTVDYVDDYGIIYHIVYDTDGIMFDIYTEIFDPHIYGEEDSGYMIGKKVFRKGILTRTRQIMMRSSSTTYVIVAEGSDQSITYRQTNYMCPDVEPEDPFTNHLDCYFKDELELIITKGPKWTTPSDDSIHWESP